MSIDINFIDVQKILCNSSEIFELNCQIFDDQGNPKSFDGGHLSIYGAKFLGKKLANDLEMMIFN